MAHRSWTIAVASVSLAAFLSVLGLGMVASATSVRNCDGGDGKGRKLLRVIGLTGDNKLICFNEKKPGRALVLGEITGLTSGDTALVGIDFRVQDGRLWGVGNAGGVYTIDVESAVATPAGALTIALEGTSFGVDFNPAADRLRIVSDTGQNLRHNVNAGGVTLEDGDLSYAPPAAATGIAGAAYTNNDLVPATATSLFDLDAALDQIAIQAPPNNGNLGATGKLNVDGTAPVGFDVYSVLDEDVTVDNRGFASFTAFGAPAFYRVDVLTGAATFVGTFRVPVSDIAVPLDQ
jgi:Domain of unknown function (DUF4394)